MGLRKINKGSDSHPNFGFTTKEPSSKTPRPKKDEGGPSIKVNLSGSANKKMHQFLKQRGILEKGIFLAQMAQQGIAIVEEKIKKLKKNLDRKNHPSEINFDELKQEINHLCETYRVDDQKLLDGKGHRQHLKETFKKFELPMEGEARFIPNTTLHCLGLNTSQASSNNLSRLGYLRLQKDFIEKKLTALYPPHPQDKEKIEAFLDHFSQGIIKNKKNLIKIQAINFNNFNKNIID